MNKTLETMISSGQIRMYIDCGGCHLRDNCANSALGCTNYKSYKPIKEDEKENPREITP